MASKKALCKAHLEQSEVSFFVSSLQKKRGKFMSEEEQVSTPLEVKENTDTSTSEPTQVETSTSEEPVTETDKAENGQENDKESDGQTDTPEWFKKDKYKTVEDQAKAYAELEKVHTEKAQKLAELEKKQKYFEQQQKEIELKKQENSISEEDSQLNVWYEGQKKNEAKLKANALAKLQKSLVDDGLGAEQIANIIANEDQRLTGEYNNRINVLDNVYKTQSEKIKTSREQFKQTQRDKNYGVLEEKYKDDLKDEAFKMLFDEYKAKSDNTSEFENFVVPLFKKVLEKKGFEKSKVSQVNTIKKQQSEAQQTSGNATKDNSLTGGIIKNALSDDSTLASLISMG